MRIALALAVLLLPAAAFARNEMPAGPIPVHKCVQSTEDVRCGPVRDGAGLAASVGYTRAYQWNDTTLSQQAMSAQRGNAGRYITR
jgi:hypothetical protein